MGVKETFFFFIILGISLFPLLCLSDPQPLQDFCVADLRSGDTINGFKCKPASNVTSDDFFYDGLSKENKNKTIFGTALTPGNVLKFAGVNTLGLSMNRVDFAPGGLNPLHWHPRASEMVLVIEGKLLVGFISTSNVYYSKIVRKGEIFIIPRGLAHFQYNGGKKKALAFTAFDSQLPGAAVIPLNLFASVPDVSMEVLTKSLQVEQKIIDDIKSKFST